MLRREVPTVGMLIKFPGREGNVDWVSRRLTPRLYSAGKLAVDCERQNVPSKTWRTIFVAARALFCGCSRLSGPYAGADVGDRADQSTRAPEIVRFDGFEDDWKN